MNKSKQKSKQKIKNKKEQILDKPTQLCEPKNECFICLEIDCNDENPIKLNESLYYPKNCDCNVFVHEFCLDKWYFTSSYICPICKENIFTDVIQEPINQNVVTVNNNPEISNFFIVKVETNWNKIKNT